MAYEEWAEVAPIDGDVTTLARLLLGLADDARHVRTIENGIAFEVPPYLAERYLKAIAPAPADEKKPRRTRTKKEGEE
jgi:hypothetical protein